MTLIELLDRVQELLGQSPTEFYNINRRKGRLNVIQNMVVRETHALLETVDISLPGGQDYITKPADYLSLAPVTPVFFEGVYSSATQLYPVRTVSRRFLDTVRRATDLPEIPRYLAEYEDTLIFSVEPPAGSTLRLTYVKAPAPMAALDDLPFDGEPMFLEFAEALAYKLAGELLLPQAPQQTQVYEGYYLEFVRRMRHKINKNAQSDQFLPAVPVTRWGRRRNAFR